MYVYYIIFLFIISYYIIVYDILSYHKISYNIKLSYIVLYIRLLDIYAFICMVLSTVRSFSVACHLRDRPCQQPFAQLVHINHNFAAFRASNLFYGIESMYISKAVWEQKTLAPLLDTQARGDKHWPTTSMGSWRLPRCTCHLWKLLPFSRCDFVAIIRGGCFCWLCPLMNLDWLLAAALLLAASLKDSVLFLFPNVLSSGCMDAVCAIRSRICLLLIGCEFPESGPNMPPCCHGLRSEEGLHEDGQPWTYFDAISAFDTSKLKPCTSTRLTDDNIMRNYLTITGDTAGVYQNTSVDSQDERNRWRVQRVQA